MYVVHTAGVNSYTTLNTHMGILWEMNKKNTVPSNAGQGKIFPFLRPKTRGNEFQKLAIWGTIFVGAKRSVE